MKKYKLLLSGIMLFVLSVVGFRSLASAHSFQTGANVIVNSNQKIDHSLFAAGNSVDIGGEVFGDVFCAGQTINVSGTVHGDVICAGQTLNITGNVDGDVRLAGQSITVEGNVGGNATIAGQAFILSSSANITGDLTLGSTDGTLNGKIGRDIAVGGGNVMIANSVGRDIKGNVEHLRLLSGANVKGNIEFTSKNQLEQDSSAIVGGSVTRKDVPEPGKPKRGAVLGFGIMWFGYWLLATLFTAMFFVLLFPSQLHKMTNRAVTHPWKPILTGFVAGISVPVLLITLAITIIGIPLAFLLGLIWLVIAFLSGPVFGYFLGRLVLRNSRNAVAIMAVGVLSLVVLYFVPIIGFLIFLIGFWGGVGIILLDIFHSMPRPSYAVTNSSVSKVSNKTKRK